MEFGVQVQFVHYSNLLDGIKLPWKLTKEVAVRSKRGEDQPEEELEGEDDSHPYQVVTDHLWTLELCERMARSKKFPDDLITRLHTELMQNVLLSAGEFREFDLKTGAVPARKVAVHVRKYTEFLNKMFRRAKNPESFAWTMHHELARIQPFVSGNGRVARLIYALLRMKARLPLDPDSLSHRGSYIERINEYFKKKVKASQRLRAQSKDG